MACILLRQKPARLAVVAIILAGSLGYAATFGRLGDTAGIESIGQLYAHVREAGEDWIGLGKILGREFDYSQDVTIAIGGTGAVPYYSRLRTVDTLGLNDRWVATDSAILGAKSGHQRIATLDYLKKRGVNLVFGYQVIPLDRPSQTLRNLRVVEIALPSGQTFAALYLKPNAIIDESIRRNGWREIPVGRAGNRGNWVQGHREMPVTATSSDSCSIPCFPWYTFVYPSSARQGARTASI